MSIHMSAHRFLYDVAGDSRYGRVRLSNAGQMYAIIINMQGSAMLS